MLKLCTSRVMAWQHLLYTHMPLCPAQLKVRLKTLCTTMWLLQLHHCLSLSRLQKRRQVLGPSWRQLTAAHNHNCSLSAQADLLDNWPLVDRPLGLTAAFLAYTTQLIGGRAPKENPGTGIATNNQPFFTSTRNDADTRYAQGKLSAQNKASSLPGGEELSHHQSLA